MYGLIEKQNQPINKNRWLQLVVKQNKMDDIKTGQKLL